MLQSIEGRRRRRRRRRGRNILLNKSCAKLFIACLVLLLACTGGSRFIFDPPGPDGRIRGHYFHTWCLYVRPFKRLENKNTRTVKTKDATTLNGAWWITKLVRLVFFLLLSKKDSCNFQKVSGLGFRTSVEDSLYFPVTQVLCSNVTELQSVFSYHIYFSLSK